MKKLKYIIDHDELTPIEIKGRIYFLDYSYISRFKRLNIHDFREVGEFMKDVKEKCENVKIVKR